MNFAQNKGFGTCCPGASAGSCNPQPTGSCQNLPQDATPCSGTPVPSVDTNYTFSQYCSGACTFYCSGGNTRVLETRGDSHNLLCGPDARGSCSGNIPPIGAVPCLTNFTPPLPYSYPPTVTAYVNNCSTATNTCAFTCLDGYTYSGGYCWSNKCTGTIPQNAAPSDFSSATGSWNYSTTTPVKPCQYGCQYGFFYDSTTNTCVRGFCQTVPLGAAKCGLTSELPNVPNYPVNIADRVSDCGSNPCSYYCDPSAGYHCDQVGYVLCNSCVANSCVAVPNSTACGGTPLPITDKFATTITGNSSSSCTGKTCTAYCNAGYHNSYNTCVVNSCGSLPASSTACPGTLAPAVNGAAYTVAANCVGAGACTAMCSSGTTLSNGSCVCNSGYDCDGTCGGNNYWTDACGTECGGVASNTCSASTPSSCGQTNTGTYACGGSCSASSAACPKPKTCCAPDPNCHPAKGRFCADVCGPCGGSGGGVLS